jgi:hypothetical protein
VGRAQADAGFGETAADLERVASTVTSSAPVVALTFREWTVVLAPAEEIPSGTPG